jgi:catechol 2,3-dioxygenase-like lactoylglutathione lyase family enzyme
MKTAEAVRFHLSLNVSNIETASAYFERVFGQPATKRRHDYAKFELDNPPLVLSLEPRSPAQHGSVNHVGFRFADAESLVDVQRRLETAGIHTEREEGVECCYAKQTKFWLNDFDNRLWEFYVLEGDIDHRGAGQELDHVIEREAESAVAPQRAPVIWEHFMTQPFTGPAEKCDEIRLRGTFNESISEGEIQRRLEQAAAWLVPGGKIYLHNMTSDVALSADQLDLPGRASVVQYVPNRERLLNALAHAGFQQIAFSKLGGSPCFVRGGHELRETMIEARMPAGSCGDDRFDVVYRGPFASLTDDEGHVYPRGVRVAICERTWQTLSSLGVSELFTRMPPGAASTTRSVQPAVSNAGAGCCSAPA